MPCDIKLSYCYLVVTVIVTVIVIMFYLKNIKNDYDEVTCSAIARNNAQASVSEKFS